ncbi:MAG: cupin-like domain-containing protein [Candidatus Riflebacteria bacterium]|nr:cupin-like domain-containing protein [Candidatus Riflebacteria bacterium]
MGRIKQSQGFEWTLQSILDPVPVEEFFREYWGKKPLLVSRKNPDYFKGLFSLDDMDDILRFTAPTDLWARKVDMAVKYSSVLQHMLYEQNTPGFNYQMIRRSLNTASVVLNFIEKDNNRVYHLTRTLEEELRNRITGPIWANAYLTPGNSYIGLHRDSHDEINLQFVGSKSWRVYEQDVRFPYDRMPLELVLPPKDGKSRFHEQKPIMEFILNQGDFLYMPRGYWHDPVNTDKDFSLGLTLGVRPICWLQALGYSLRAAAGNHEELRNTLPIEFSDNPGALEVIHQESYRLLGHLREWLSIPETLEDLRKQTPAAPIPLNEVVFPSIEELAQLNPASRLNKLPVDLWTCHFTSGMLRLNIKQRVIGLRRELKNSLEYIRNSSTFSPSDLPDDLKPEEKLNLCRFLLNFGVILCQKRMF